MLAEKSAIEISPGTRLCLKSYAPAAGSTRRDEPILLVHGLLNSSELFDVPGLESLSLVKTFADRGYRVFTYDQRGSGESTTANWDFGLAENVFLDLPAVIRHCLGQTGSRRVILGGYSLGGLIIYGLVSYLARFPEESPDLPLAAIAKVFCITSPGAIHQRQGRWKDLFTRGDALFRKDGPTIDRTDFIYAQIAIGSPRLAKWLTPRLIEAATKAASRSTVAAALLKALPLPSFLYRRSDFRPRSFRALLNSKVLDRTSSKLFSDLYSFAARGGAIELSNRGRAVRLPDDFAAWTGVPLLLISSRKDELVLTSEVEEIVHRRPDAVYFNTDDKLGRGCGHAGYVFKKKLTSAVRRMIVQFLEGGGADGGLD